MTARRIEALTFLILIASCLAVFFFRLGSVPFLDPGDGYFTEASREMIERGDFIVPHLNYQIYFSKPILIYWLIIGAYKVLGVNELAGRIWSAIFASALVLCTYWMVRSLANRRAGIFAALVLITSPLVVTFARMALVDMVFSSLLGIALCALVMTCFVGSGRWWPVLYLALGLSVLTKGPAGIVLFGLGVTGFLLVARPRKQWMLQQFGSLHAPLGSLIFASVVLPWHIAVGIATRGLFLKVFYLYENLGRYAGHTNHRHPEFWYYLPVLAYGFFPWVLFLPPAARQLWVANRSITRLGTDESTQAQGKSSGLLLVACWATAIFLFFTLTSTKLETYILPSISAFAVLIGCTLDDWLTRLEEGKPVSRWMKGNSICLAAISVASVIAALIGAAVVKEISTGLKVWAIAGALCLAIGWTRQAILFKRGSYSRSLCWLLGSAVVACAILAPVAFEIGYKYKQQDVHAVIEAIKGQDAQVALYREFKPTLMFYLHKPIDSFFSPDQIVADRPWDPLESTCRHASLSIL